MDSINYEKLAQETKEVQQTFEQHEQVEHNHIPALKQVIHTHYTPQTEEDKQETTNTSLPSYATNAPEEAKKEVATLIKYTFEKGLLEGIREAKKKDPFILDMYHDALVEKLHEEMKRKGLL